jgi:YidC/Oxa1 family membrane protein insertase
MKTEARFLVAVVLMLGVLVGTNRLFPPVIPELTEEAGDSTDARSTPADRATVPELGGVSGGQPAAPGLGSTNLEGTPFAEGPAPAVDVAVEGPLYRYHFTSRGARMVSGELVKFQALNRGGGPVEVVPEGAGPYLGQRLVVGSDTLDLSSVPFSVEPERGLRLTEGSSPQTLRFVYDHPTSDFQFVIAYTFDPDKYVVGVSGSIRGVDRALLLTDLGEGLALAEADSTQEARGMAYVQNHLGDGIRSTLLSKATPTVVEGPLVWAAFRNKFFLLALLAGQDEEVSDARYLGGLLVRQGELADRSRIEVAQTVTQRDGYAFRLFMGPQEYARLSSIGQDMDEVNPYGWRVFRPILRPIVSVIMTVLAFLHTNLNLSYGWVLIVFGVLMRVVFFPLYHKSMKAQVKNMAVQPLMKEIQDKYKDNPEKLQKEMMRLYKEHGFNPLAGCLPMMLPMPVLIALFFVFRNTIELRGVPFLWLPDLSAKDPLFILPVVLALSMFVMQWVSLKSVDQPNQQMKMMMYVMPPIMLMMFLNFASGLNLYYATANIATIPQSIWIARERQRMQNRPPMTLANRE